MRLVPDPETRKPWRLRRALRDAWTGTKRIFDLRDVFVFGGLLLASTGAGLIVSGLVSTRVGWGAGLLLFGAVVLVLGLFGASAPGQPKPGDRG